jgi:Domain of unknown function (DUF4145)
VTVGRYQYDLDMRMVCPHCRVLTHFTEVWSDNPFNPEITFRGDTAVRGCWVCDNCNCPVSGITLGRGNVSDPVVVWPEAVTYRSYEDVPDAIASAGSEAHQALGAKAPRAAVAMARAVVESTAKDKGITSGNLQAKIDRLHAYGHISEAMKEAAHEIRFAGNEVAHGDLVHEPIGVDDATEVVDLMDAILERVYQEPAKVARVRASREARQNPQVPA